MKLQTMYKDGKELQCNPSEESIKQLEKFGWSRTNAKREQKNIDKEVLSLKKKTKKKAK